MDEQTTGQRIAATRRHHGLTQQALAQLAGISTSHLAHVEQGHRQPTSTVLAAIARAMGVSVPDLTGQPYIDELRREHLDGLIQPLREALDIHDLGADPDLRPRPHHAIDSHAQQLASLIRSGELRTVAGELPAVVTEATTAAHSSTSTGPWRTLAILYRCGYDIASKLGYHDLSMTALDRSGWAAERAGDANLAAVRQYNRSLGHLRAGNYKVGMRLAELARATAAQADPGQTRDAVTGQSHLASAVLAARAADADTVEEHIAAAARIAARTGEIPRELWLSWGGTNVSVHHVSALIDQMRYAQALALARTLQIPRDWAASRAAHHHAEIARAYLWTGKPARAHREILQARRLAPQQTRLSPIVRDTVTGLLRSGRAKHGGTHTVDAYARWIGLHP
ncbi:helix-turn-helix transcriptional regulator [Kitasatospora sp. NPDC047058]|uniref:helix-turn-helix domain-containing protein n=1 Tax=Kitasatospora sp. NPDC047058 TaxID=3155620 RepID=UPI0033CDB6EA